MPDASDSERPIWNGFTRAALDAAYNNMAAVPESGAFLADWTARSQTTRTRPGTVLDLAYGPRERNRIDLWRCGQDGAPLLVFIHGGYWQRNAKEVFACMAEGPLAAGFDVALPGYTLAPEATLTQIVAEIREALRFLRRVGPAHGVAEAELILSGWSAGGHLTAMALDMPEVDAGLSISGVFDVEPCRLNYLNEKLGLTSEEALANSPLYQIDPAQKPLVAAYGEAELSELRRQSIDYVTAATARGATAVLRPLAGHDHFSILEELARPGGALVKAASEALELARIARTRRGAA